MERKSFLTFIEQTVFSDNNAFTKALYRCDCGNIKEINMRKVRELRTLSCGCYRSRLLRDKHTTHGLSDHLLYDVWIGIKKRCYNESEPAYIRYGGVGVKMCDEWFYHPEKFVQWALAKGWEPGLEIDKDIIPNKMGIPAIVYSPEMCSIVTRKENCNARNSNVLLTFNGKTQNVKQWSDEIGISSSLIRGRLVHLKWSVEKTLSTTPLHNGGRRKINKTA